MAILNRKCVVCGKEYSYCPSCGQDSDKPGWMTTFCGENCRSVYHACAGHYAGQLKDEEVKKMLEKCDLSNKENFTESVQKVIDNICVNNKEENVEIKNTYTKTNYSKKNKRR